MALEYKGEVYCQYRPSYTQAFYDRLYEYHRGHGGEFEVAIDAATGTGQAATKLAEDFEIVHALDISPVMISSAKKLPNIHYRLSPAEDLSAFDDNSVDLVVVAEALHFFALPKFFGEVRRVLKPNGTFAAIGYIDLVFIDSPKATEKLKEQLEAPGGLNSYRDPRVALVESLYTHVDIPLKNVQRTYYGHSGSNCDLSLVMEARVPLKWVENNQYTTSMFTKFAKDKGEKVAEEAIKKMIREVVVVEPTWTEETEVRLTWKSVTIFAERM